jgi:hypothetical protein
VRWLILLMANQSASKRLDVSSSAGRRAARRRLPPPVGLALEEVFKSFLQTLEHLLMNIVITPQQSRGMM